MKEYKYKINGNVYKVAIGDIEDNIAHVEVNGTPYKVEMEKAPKVVVKPVARPAATSAPAAPATPVVKPAAASTGKSGVKSPLPGVILDIKVNVGDTVKKGQVIIILEAMKMENNINADKDGKITVEVKSVNHRYLDVNIKMPKKLNFFESAIRTLLKEYIERGKVDIYITYEDFTENNLSLQYNKALAGEYLKYLNQMAEEFGLENDIKVSTLSRYPEVFAMEEQPVDEDELWSSLEKALRGAFEPFVESRVREGENLKKDLCEKLDNMVSYVDFIEERSPQIIVEYRARLEEKLRELLADNQLDDSRIAQEVTIFADKICVDEETVRLKSHILSMKDSLNAGGSVGRKLDFLAQEMNREANTILSKSNDLKISDTGISLKTDIEKVREQIQNIE